MYDKARIGFSPEQPSGADGVDLQDLSFDLRNDSQQNR